MGAVRLLRSLAPLVLVAGLVAACGNGSDSGSGGTTDSTILGASKGFEAREVFARYEPGVPFGPQIPQAVVQEMQKQQCPMTPRITDQMLMECDAAKGVYLLRNPLVVGSVASAVPKQIGHGKIWYVEVKLTDDVSQKLAKAVPSMTGQQLAFSYDGRVLTSIAIDSSFHPSHFAITGDYDKASATKLAQELTA
jgi:preprotein translocase subunit SecD